jgi:hypothetical protein
VLRRFQDERWIRVQRRDLELMEPAKIELLAAPVLRRDAPAIT